MFCIFDFDFIVDMVESVCIRYIVCLVCNFIYIDVMLFYDLWVLVFLMCWGLFSRFY